MVVRQDQEEAVVATVVSASNILAKNWSVTELTVDNNQPEI